MLRVARSRINETFTIITLRDTPHGLAGKPLSIGFPALFAETIRERFRRLRAHPAKSAATVSVH
jgi:hypothetical protein